MNENDVLFALAVSVPAAWTTVRLTQLALAYRKSQRDAERRAAVEAVKVVAK